MDSEEKTFEYFASLSPNPEEVLNMIPSKPPEKAIGDYYDDNGDLICGKCHSPKTIDNGKKACMCKCAEERESEEQRRKREEQIEEKQNNCFSSNVWKKSTFDSLEGNTKAFNIARAYCKRWEDVKKRGYGLIFSGNTGTGKTSLAAAIANDVIRQGGSARMVSAVQIMVRADEKSGFVDYVNYICTHSSLLILDDYGSDRGTDFAHEKLLYFIEEWQNTGKPMIVTTNLTPEELNTANRLNSRIVKDKAIVTVVGNDRRKSSGAAVLEFLKEYMDSD